MNTGLVTEQPGVVTLPGQHDQWQTDLCDCCSDVRVCLCGLCCFPCLGCQVASEMDECCLCGPAMAMRTLYRTRYGIPGSLMGDFFAAVCCRFCAICQLKRDINKRKDMGMF